MLVNMGPSDVVAVYTFDERVKAVLLLTPAPKPLRGPSASIRSNRVPTYSSIKPYPRR